MLKPIQIGKHTISTDNSPFVIAEISANHNGSLERALQTIKAAKSCGVHAVKIQTYTPDTMTIKSNKDVCLIQQVDACIPHRLIHHLQETTTFKSVDL